MNRANNDIARVLGDIELSAMPEEPEEAIHFRRPETYGLFSKLFFNSHGRKLFACSMAWLIVDIPYYGSTLFQSKICGSHCDPSENINAYQEAINIAKFQAILAAASTIPGYWATVYFIDRVGRRKIQMMGFFFMAVFLFCLGGPYDAYWDHHTNGWFLVLYGLTFFFSNFGPNTITFILPAELFPARFRSTCHGISGAAGKVGAIIGSVGFLWASQDKDKKKVEEGWKAGLGMMNVLIILGGVCIVGVVLTYFFTPETMGRSLEENEEDEEQDGENDGHLNGAVA